MQNSETFQTAPEIAYNIILKKILDGEYVPGMRLSRRKMAEVTNVSVIPVIEALKKLEEDGLVDSQPKWGSFVAVPTVEKVIESYDAREAIECQVARILCEKMTPDQKADLYKLAEELDTIPYDATTVDASRDRHMMFHKTMVEYSGNAMLSRMLRHVNLFWILCSAMVERASNEKYPRYWH
ncbi:MAG: GntR family transcriptional regulator, partial [Lachnospiraceae bacterium]|nr:GntR family transcriptional regulator [Lachnospiraceae bacterium]